MARYYKMRQTLKCDSYFNAKCDAYYKKWQLFYYQMQQFYYKMRQYIHKFINVSTYSEVSLLGSPKLSNDTLNPVQ